MQKISQATGMIYLWDWEHGCEVDDEIVLEVAQRDLVGVAYELSAAEHARAGRDEGDAELEDHVREVEEVGDAADDGDGGADAQVHGHARVVPVGVEEVEVERVHEQPHQAGHQEQPVPPQHHVVARVQDPARRPRRPARGAGPRAGGRVEEGQRRAAERRQDAPVDEGGHGGGRRAASGEAGAEAAWMVRMPRAWAASLRALRGGGMAWRAMRSCSRLIATSSCARCFVEQMVCHRARVCRRRGRAMQRLVLRVPDRWTGIDEVAPYT